LGSYLTHGYADREKVCELILRVAHIDEPERSPANGCRTSTTNSSGWSPRTTSGQA